MPPKKGKKSRPTTGTVKETHNPDDLKKIEQLENQIKQLNVNVEAQAVDRNFFQLERDKIHTLYEVANNTIEQLKNSLQSKDRQIEELVENHQVSIRVYQQKIKDILYNNNQQNTQIKINNENNLRTEEDHHRVREVELLEQIEAQKLKIKENQLSFQDSLRAEKEQGQLNCKNLRQQYEQQLFNLQRDFEVKLRDLLQEAELRRKAEIQEVETNKNNTINNLVQKHQINFDKMKKYYLEITNSNLELIKALKDEVEEMRKKQVANEQLMFDVAQENKRLTQPLQTALAEAEQLKKKLAEANALNAELKESKEKADMRLKLIEILMGEVDDLKTSLKDTAMERDELQKNFKDAIQDVEKVNSFKEQVLNRRICALQDELQKLTTVHNEVLAAGHLQGAVAQAITQQTDNVLEGKNRNIRELSFELARVMRLYNEALRVFRSKMVAAGLNVNDMDGFRPFEVRDDL